MFGFGTKIDAQQINKELVEGTALLVDVRNDNEWQSDHASGAVHLAVDKILEGEVPTNDTSKKIYLYCASGNRAGIATDTLEQKGYNAENIGGLSTWRAAGGKTQ